MCIRDRSSERKKLEVPPTSGLTRNLIDYLLIKAAEITLYPWQCFCCHQNGYRCCSYDFHCHCLYYHPIHLVITLAITLSHHFLNSLYIFDLCAVPYQSFVSRYQHYCLLSYIRQMCKIKTSVIVAILIKTSSHWIGHQWDLITKVCR